MATYKIHPRHADKTVLITLGAAGKPVNLAGKPTVRRHPATATAAAWEETIPAASQADLEKVYKEGAKDADRYPLVVAVESKEAKATESDKK